MILFEAISSSTFQSFFELLGAKVPSNSKKGFPLRSGLGQFNQKKQYCMQKFICFSALFFSLQVFSQQQGYWDKDRATTKEINASARERIIIKTENFPTGTTEVVYRITLLNENQQLANSLASVLKAVPDPSGISQGSAGAVFILSKVSGEDKCKYAVFSNANLAKNYKENGSFEKACWFQNEAVNKDVKILSIGKSSCLNSETQNLWFGFENKNWIMNQKIIIEVIPWVNYNSSKGWTTDNRKAIISLVKTSNLAKKMINSDDFSVCILDKIQSKYTFQDYSNLLAIEKTKTFKDFGNICLSDKITNASLLETIRNDATQYFKNQKYTQAIDLILNTIIDRNNANCLDYNNLGMYYLYSKQFEKAIKTLKEGEMLDNSELLIQLNLANAYLLNDNFRAAKEIHKKYKSQNINATESWNSKAKSEIEALSKIGIQNKDFDKILKILEE